LKEIREKFFQWLRKRKSNKKARSSGALGKLNIAEAIEEIEYAELPAL
jgi:hypothetical protein